LATTLDSDIHTLVSVAERCSLENGEGFLPPKSKPIIVSNDEDVEGINFSAFRVDFGGMNVEMFPKLYEIRPEKDCLR
jgi:hypothetical protein